MMTVEFLILGGLAGLIGVVAAGILSLILLHKLDVGFHLNWGISVAAVITTAILSSMVGWLASHRILQQKPLQVLREE